jgi:hypothetical protein
MNLAKLAGGPTHVREVSKISVQASLGMRTYSFKVSGLRRKIIRIVLLERRRKLCPTNVYLTLHHHEHPGLGHLARSVSSVKVAQSIVSLVSQLFSFLVGCKVMILKGFGFVAFFADVKASSFCIHL